MDLAVLDPTELSCALRALHGVLISNHSLTTAERRFLEVIAELAWKYEQLGLLPAGTLGRELWEHCTSRRFAFPGEPGAIPERLVFHDWGHVLAGYGTEPQDEIQQGAFQAGFMRQDGFAFLMFVVIQLHLGIQVTPVAASEVGLFDVAKVLRAAQRGAACKVDLSDHWDPFAVAHRPLAELREEYGIPPLQASAADSY